MNSPVWNGFANVRWKKYIIDKDNNKKMVEGTKSFTLDEIHNWEHSAAFEVPEDIVVLDADDKTEGQVLIKILKDKHIRCLISETTKGYHFYFRIPKDVRLGNWVRVGLPIGLANFDIRSGQVVGNIIEYREGKWCNWIIGPQYDENNKCFRLDGYDFDDLPFWLTPISKKSQMPSLVNLTEGSRNDELFKHKCRLANVGWDEKQVYETFEIINAYVFKEALDERELKTVARFGEREARLQKQNWFDDKGRFLHHIMGDYLSEILYCYRDNRDVLWYYNGEIYSTDEKILLRKIVEICPVLKENQRREVVKHMDLAQLQSTIVPDEKNNFIAVKNGLVNADNGQLTAFSPMYFLTNNFDIEYVENAYDPFVDKFLNDVLVVKGDKEQRMIFEEFLGYTLIAKDNFMKKMLFMIGPNANNGKSTTLMMIQDLLSTKNYSAIKIFQLSENNKFALSGLANKILNVDDDAESTKISGATMSNLKHLVSNNATIQVDVKFKDPKLMTMKAKFWIASNHIIKTEQKGDEWMTRLEILSFDNQFNGRNRDPSIIKKLITPNAKSYLLKLAIEGWQRLRDNNWTFTKSKTSELWTNMYRKENDSLYRFLDWRKFDINYLDNKLIKSIYDEYKSYLQCEEPDQVKFIRSINALEKMILEVFKGKITSEIINNGRFFKKKEELNVEKLFGLEG